MLPKFLSVGNYFVIGSLTLFTPVTLLAQTTCKSALRANLIHLDNENGQIESWIKKNRLEYAENASGRANFLRDLKQWLGGGQNNNNLIGLLVAPSLVTLVLGPPKNSEQSRTLKSSKSVTSRGGGEEKLLSADFRDLESKAAEVRNDQRLKKINADIKVETDFLRINFRGSNTQLEDKIRSLVADRDALINRLMSEKLGPFAQQYQKGFAIRNEDGVVHTAGYYDARHGLVVSVPNPNYKPENEASSQRHEQSVELTIHEKHKRLVDAYFLRIASDPRMSLAIERVIKDLISNPLNFYSVFSFELKVFEKSYDKLDDKLDDTGNELKAAVERNASQIKKESPDEYMIYMALASHLILSNTVVDRSDFMASRDPLTISRERAKIGGLLRSNFKEIYPEFFWSILGYRHNDFVTMPYALFREISQNSNP